MAHQSENFISTYVSDTVGNWHRDPVGHGCGEPAAACALMAWSSLGMWVLPCFSRKALYKAAEISAWVAADAGGGRAPWYGLLPVWACGCQMQDNKLWSSYLPSLRATLVPYQTSEALTWGQCPCRSEQFPSWIAEDECAPWSCPVRISAQHCTRQEKKSPIKSSSHHPSPAQGSAASEQDSNSHSILVSRKKTLSRGGMNQPDAHCDEVYHWGGLLELVSFLWHVISWTQCPHRREQTPGSVAEEWSVPWSGPLPVLVCGCKMQDIKQQGQRQDNKLWKQHPLSPRAKPKAQPDSCILNFSWTNTRC